MKFNRTLIFGLLIAMTITVTGCDNGSNDNYYKAGYPDYVLSDYGAHSAYNLDYVGSKNTQNILVIPVEIKGCEENANEETREKIEKAFFGSEKDTGWESVTSYYNESSFNRLTIKGEVTPWFDIGLTPSEIYTHEDPSYGEYGTMYVLEQAFLWAVNEQGIDMSKYDNDGDGYVEGIILIYSAPNFTNWGEYYNLGDTLGYWAFTYWDYHFVYGGYTITDDETGEEYPYKPHGYCWMSYDFMEEKTGDNGIIIDAHTYIHEFGHLLGLADYYDVDDEHCPMGFVDMMDANIGDHNSYSKYALGWVKPYVVTGNASITIGPASTTGDCIILKNNAGTRFYDNAFSEYLLIELITPEGLWEQDATYPYYTNNNNDGLYAYQEAGIRVTHVDARMYAIGTGAVISDPSMYRGYDLVKYCSNTTSRSDYQTNSKSVHPDEISLIVPSKKNIDGTVFQTESNWWATSDCLFKQGDKFTVDSFSGFFVDGKMHDGTRLNYSFTIDSLSNESATITFKKGK